MHLLRIDVLQVLRGINATAFVKSPAARLAFKETVVRTVGYIALTDVSILRVLRMKIALEQEQTQGQAQEGLRLQQPVVVSSPYPYPPLPRDPIDSPPPIHEVVLGSPFQLLSGQDEVEIQVDYSIAFIIEEVGFKNVTQAFDVTDKKLRSSVLARAFEAMLVGIAKNYTVDLLLHASTSNLLQSTIQSVQIHIAPSSMPTLAPTDAAQDSSAPDKVVVVVGFLLVCAVMLIACFCVFNARHVLIYLHLKRRQQVQVLDMSALKQHDTRMQELRKRAGSCKPGFDELDEPAFPVAGDKYRQGQAKGADRETATPGAGTFSPGATSADNSPIQLRDIKCKSVFSDFVKHFEGDVPTFSPDPRKKYKIVPGLSLLSPTSPPPSGNAFAAFTDHFTHADKVKTFFSLADVKDVAKHLAAAPPSGTKRRGSTLNFRAFTDNFKHAHPGKVVPQLSPTSQPLPPAPPPSSGNEEPGSGNSTPTFNVFVESVAHAGLADAAPLPSSASEGLDSAKYKPDFRAFTDTFKKNKVAPHGFANAAPPLSPPSPPLLSSAPPPPSSGGFRTFTATFKPLTDSVAPHGGLADAAKPLLSPALLPPSSGTAAGHIKPGTAAGQGSANAKPGFRAFPDTIKQPLPDSVALHGGLADAAKPLLSPAPPQLLSPASLPSSGIAGRGSAGYTPNFRAFVKAHGGLANVATHAVPPLLSPASPPLPQATRGRGSANAKPSIRAFTDTFKPQTDSVAPQAGLAVAALSSAPPPLSPGAAAGRGSARIKPGFRAFTDTFK
ncbi:hypothetical protein B484DRAFT_482739 [Ochromonadaceae sp. CCMP2298]|nr:hypothetical protein B484DRAFT_482739 [Ochromonadaceae sp. CCMP2298]